MSKNQNNTGAQNLGESNSAPSYGNSKSQAKRYAAMQVNDKPGEGQQMNKTKVVGDSR